MRASAPLAPSTTEVDAPATAPAPADDLSAMARGGIVNLAGAVAYAVLAFVVTVVIARGFGPARAGVFFEASAMFLLVSNICELGADTGLVWAIPRYRVLGRGHDVRKVVAVGVLPGTVLAVAVAALLFALAPHLASVLTQSQHKADLIHDLRVLLPFLPLSVALTLLLSATRGFGTMVPSVATDKVGRSVLQASAVLAVSLGGLGAGWVAWAWAAPFAVAAVPALLWLASLIRRAERRPGPRTVPATGQKPVISEFWRFSLPRALAASLKVGVDKLDIVLVASLASARAAGIYTASTRLIIAGTMASVAISQALGPTISRHFAGRAAEQARSAYQAATAWVVLVTWPLFLNLIVFGPVVLGVFGKPYANGWVAVLLVSAAMLVASAVGPVDLVLLMGGRSLWSMGNMALALTTNVVLNFVLVPHLGLAGAGIAWGASILLINVLALGQVWRLLSIHPFGKGTLLATAASAVCFGVLPALVRLTVGAGVATWLVTGVVGGAAYAVFCWRRRDVLRLSELAGALRWRARRRARDGAGDSNALRLRPGNGVRPAAEGG